MDLFDWLHTNRKICGEFRVNRIRPAVNCSAITEPAGRALILQKIGSHSDTITQLFSTEDLEKVFWISQEFGSLPTRTCFAKRLETRGLQVSRAGGESTHFVHAQTPLRRRTVRRTRRRRCRRKRTRRHRSTCRRHYADTRADARADKRTCRRHCADARARVDPRAGLRTRMGAQNDVVQTREADGYHSDNGCVARDVRVDHEDPSPRAPRWRRW